jgi:antitoxin YefM
LVENSSQEDETDYLFRSPANKRQLLDALDNARKGNVMSVDLDEYEKNFL